MERLTYRCGNGNTVMNCVKCELDGADKCTTLGCRDRIRDRLAAIEDAEEQGRLVILPEPTPDIDFMRILNLVMADAENRVIVLPCKVGDTVYINTTNGVTLTEVVDSATKPQFRTKTVEGLRGLDFEFCDYGKTVFLSREEAKKALEGME